MGSILSLKEIANQSFGINATTGVSRVKADHGIEFAAPDASFDNDLSTPKPGV